MCCDDMPGALHVRSSGRSSIAWAGRWGRGIDRATSGATCARRRAREAYVHSSTAADAPMRAYHLVIDSPRSRSTPVRADRVGGGGAQRSGELIARRRGARRRGPRGGGRGVRRGGVASRPRPRAGHRLRLRAPPDRPAPRSSGLWVPCACGVTGRVEDPSATSSRAGPQARRSPTCCGATTTPVRPDPLRAADRRAGRRDPDRHRRQAETGRHRRGTQRGRAASALRRRHRDTARSAPAIDATGREPTRGPTRHRPRPACAALTPTGSRRRGVARGPLRRRLLI